MNCGGTKLLTHTFHKRGRLICEPCRSKVPKDRQGALTFKNDKQEAWEKFANAKNHSIASKYDLAGNHK